MYTPKLMKILAPITRQAIAVRFGGGGGPDPQGFPSFMQGGENLPYKTGPGYVPEPGSSADKWTGSPSDVTRIEKDAKERAAKYKEWLKANPNGAHGHGHDHIHH